MPECPVRPAYQCAAPTSEWLKALSRFNKIGGITWNVHGSRVGSLQFLGWCPGCSWTPVGSGPPWPFVASRVRLPSSNSSVCELNRVSPGEVHEPCSTRGQRVVSAAPTSLPPSACVRRLHKEDWNVQRLSRLTQEATSPWRQRAPRHVAISPKGTVAPTCSNVLVPK